ncbi:uncharacterized protein LOC127868804 isoform X2 [Dreissena polymorpha]|uniref:uncharacterized protein LOC127868804 isoform X2 n=1 Tax=Dreissena polymorpha TaxID=45954 RepID=UPI002263EA60|nr:uncharacterized protein LOC127868804 isoform X2 [Dreissena polymorpha]
MKVGLENAGIITLTSEEFGHTNDDGPKPCNSVNDCKLDECCISNDRPIGKRLSDSVDAHGTCGPMGVMNATCYVRYPSGRPTQIVYVACPCEKDLVCHGIGVIDVPLGEVGQCELK